MKRVLCSDVGIALECAADFIFKYVVRTRIFKKEKSNTGE